MLVHCSVTPSLNLAHTHLYTWVERIVKCLAHEHTAVPSQGSNQTAGSRDKHVNDEAIIVLQKPRSQSAEAYVVACTLKLNLKGFVSNYGKDLFRPASTVWCQAQRH